jgi:parallel beta-helix repeat protein
MDRRFGLRYALVVSATLGLIWSLGISGAAHGAPGRVVVVPRDFPTIQAAVDAAAPGDTISVSSGTYTEEVVVGKDLNLRGAGAGTTIIKSPATLTPFGFNPSTGVPVTAIVRVGHGAHVRMSGFTVTGPVPCDPVTGITTVQSATLELTDARVRDIVPDNPTCTPPRGVGVQFGAPPFIVIDGVAGSTGHGRVTNVVVDNFLSIGLVATGPFDQPPSEVTFANNAITPGTPPFPTEHFGIQVARNAVAQVMDNAVSGGVCTIPGCGEDPINEFQAMGIAVILAPAGTNISDNHASDTDVGIYQIASPNCCTISQNTLTDNRFFGIVIQDGDGETRDNTITGGEIGIGVVAGGADTTGVLRGDNISGTTVAPVREIECCGFTATAIVKD